jgi:glycosyltransferase involved in cell wall biosynthesis
MRAALTVLHVIGSISPERGGPTGAVRTMMSALARRNIRVDVVATDDDGDTRRLEVPHGQFVPMDGQRVCYFPRQTVKYGLSLPLQRWLSHNVREYDIVHTHGLFAFPPLAAAWYARRARIPYVMAPHGVLDSWGIKNKSTLVKTTSIRLIEAPLLRAAAAIQFMSDLEATRAAQLELGIRPAVLPLGFDFETVRAEASQPIEALADSGKPVILFLSRIHPVKRLDVLLRAFASLPERGSAVLAIAGDGEPALVASLKRLSSELGIDAHVRWLGFVAGRAKQWLLSRATVFVLPSASENFGVAIVEAMHAEVPVVVTRGAGLAGLVEEARAGLVIDDSVESMREALARLLADETLRRELGRAGRRAVDQHLSLDAFGNRLESLYRAVLARTRDPAVAASRELPS